MFNFYCISLSTIRTSAKPAALKVGYVTAYWGAKLKKAKLTRYSNAQVRRLQDKSKNVKKEPIPALASQQPRCSPRPLKDST